MIYPTNNVSYTRMCMWIDKNAYTTGVDTEQMYKYLYHIIRCVSRLNHLFNDEIDYDDFSCEFAGDLLLRYRNDKLPEIKSVSNYVLRTIYGVSASFLRKRLPQVVEWDKKQSHENDVVIASMSSLDKIDTLECVENFPHLIRVSISNLPFDDVTKQKIYISILLSMILSIQSKEEKVVLYNLDESFRSMVTLWLRIVKQDYSYSLTDVSYSDITVQDILRDVRGFEDDER